MFDEYKIIQIKSKDIKYVINLHLEICREAYKNILNYEIMSYFQKRFIKERKKICYNKNNKDINLVVKHKDTNKIVGFVDSGTFKNYEDLRFINNKNILEIKKFFIHPCCQGTGLSKELFIEIINKSLKKNPNYCVLIILSFNENTKANNFYEKMGGKIYKIINYNINKVNYKVNCYKWINIKSMMQKH